MDELSQCLAALENPKYKWRTVDGVSRETGIPTETVRQLLESVPDKVIRSRIPDLEGRVLYTTRRHYRRTNSPLVRIMDSFRSTST